MMSRITSCDSSTEPAICTASNSSRERTSTSFTDGSFFKSSTSSLGKFKTRVLLVAGLDVRQHFGHVQISVACADFRQSFSGLKTATAAAADVKPPEQRPLRAGEFFQHVAHGRLQGNVFGSGHKSFGSSPVRLAMQIGRAHV